MKDIPLYRDFISITPVTEGLSGDKKLRAVTADGKSYLLRLADAACFEQKKREYERMKLLAAVGVPLPRAVDFGLCEDGKSVYTLIEWVEGREAGKLIRGLAPKTQYALGLKTGEALAKIHTADDRLTDEDWQKRYFSVIDGRFDAYRREGEPFEGSKAIFDFLLSSRELLKDRPQCCHHGDYHAGNMIIKPDGGLSVIDWHFVDFSSYGDPYYEFNRLDPDFPAFASGQIDGYFGKTVPVDFWQLLKYYTAASALTSIVWVKYYAPRELDSIIKLNKNIYNSFGAMKDSVPLWYKSL